MGSWSQQTSNTDVDLNGVASLSNSFVAVGAKGTILWSEDYGRSWSQQTSNTDVDLNGVASLSNSFVAVGANGTILSTPAPPTSDATRIARTALLLCLIGARELA